MLSDSTITAIRRFVHERDWEHYHCPENLAKSISIEAAELLECYQWTPQSPALDSTHVNDELADVLIYCIMMAEQLGVDMDEIIISKLKKNAQKYPARLIREQPEAAQERHWSARMSGHNADES
jgi:NTP pyrophosphatase (non-canonical NTP hydrolase)